MRYLAFALTLFIASPVWATCGDTRSYYVRNDAAANLSGSSNATTAIVSGTGTATAAATSTTVSFSGSPDLSGVTANQDTIRIAGADRSTEIYEITAVNDGADTVTVEAAPSAAGLSGVDWAIGGAFDTLNDADNHMETCGGSGHTVNVKKTATAYDELLVLDAGNTTTPNVWEGFNSTPGDAPTGTDRPVNDRGGANASAVETSGNGIIVKNMRFRNTGTANVHTSTNDSNIYHVQFINCKFDTGAICFTVSGSNKRPMSFQSEFTLCTDGVSGGEHFGAWIHDNSDDGTTSSCYWSEVKDNSGTGIEEGRGVTMLGCTITGNGSDGTRTNNVNLSNLIKWGNTVSHNTGDGFGNPYSGNNPFYYISNDVSNNSDEGWESDLKEVWHFMQYNNCYNNTNGCSENTDGTNMNLNPSYTDYANGDFSIGTNLKGAGFPGPSTSGEQTSYYDVGAVQREEAAASGGASSYTFVGN